MSHSSPYDHWDYSHLFGPARWSQTFVAASGSRQSPIDIRSDSVEFDSILRDVPLSISYSKESGFTLNNNGHSVQVSLPVGSTSLTKSQLSGGPLQHHQYRFQQLHFHWGKNSHVGSEHLVDGHAYPAELHMVHWNTEVCDSFEEAVKQEKGLAVLGIFLKQGKEHNGLKAITDLFDRVPNKGDLYRMRNNFDPGSLLPRNTEEYWTYHGSLTTPPCSECVTWIVFREPIEVSRRQLEKFRHLSGCPFYQKYGTVIGDNYRPVMPLNDRRLRATFGTS